MVVLPHSTEEPKNDAAPDETIPSLRRVQGIANTALVRTKDATANAVAASREAWTKAAEIKREAARSRAGQHMATLADRTAAQTRAAAATAVSVSKIGLAKAAKIGRETVLPELGRAGVRLRERTRPERLKQDWREFLLWWHANVGDKGIEKLFFRPTAPNVPLADLNVKGDRRAQGSDYYKPSPRLIFDWALAVVPEDFSRFSFVDYGAGRGRVLLLASQHPFAAIGGIESAAELHDDAIMNIAQFPRSRMKCRKVECVLEDATNLGPLPGEAIHYFFNAFSAQVFGEVLASIVTSYREHPRRLYLILIDQEGGEFAEASGVFQRIELPVAERLRAKLFSPYEIAIYRSLA
jgi:hypothetical protein